jgi:hypothetical protein
VRFGLSSESEGPLSARDQTPTFDAPIVFEGRGISFLEELV